MRLTVLGDMHFSPDQSHFVQAQQQINDLKSDFLFQVGDLGAYHYCGSSESFRDAKRYLEHFNTPYFTLIGNHDLEGDEFSSDQAAIEGWLSVFNPQGAHYRSIPLAENIVALLLSSSKFRENPYCAHEVFIEQEQIEWFKKELDIHRDKRVLVFSHAPPQGSGLKVLAIPHLKATNAFLNHTQDPEVFTKIIDSHPQIKMWFSGHSHLSHQHVDSISLRNNAHFIQCGVIGEVSRDGLRQSRVIDIYDHEMVISTLDHSSGMLQPCLRKPWDSKAMQRHDELIQNKPSKASAPTAFDRKKKYLEGKSSYIQACDHFWLEFHKESLAPIGIVSEKADDMKIVGHELVVSVDGIQEKRKPDKDGFFRHYYF